MPIYDYRCPLCAAALKDQYRRMDSPNPVCPQCTAAIMDKVPVRTQTDLREFHTPIEMISIAMNDPAEIRAFAARCPDVDVSDDPRSHNYGVPVARSRKAKLQALKASGFQECNSERVRR